MIELKLSKKSNNLIPRIIIVLLVILVFYIINYIRNVSLSLLKDKPIEERCNSNIKKIFIKECRDEMIHNYFGKRMDKYDSMLTDNTNIIGSLKNDILNIKANFSNITDSIKDTFNTVVEEIKRGMEKVTMIANKIVGIIYEIANIFQNLLLSGVYAFSVANTMWKGPLGLFTRKQYKRIEKIKGRKARRKKRKEVSKPKRKEARKQKREGRKARRRRRRR